MTGADVEGKGMRNERIVRCSCGAHWKGRYVNSFIIPRHRAMGHTLSSGKEQTFHRVLVPKGSVAPVVTREVARRWHKNLTRIVRGGMHDPGDTEVLAALERALAEGKP